MPYQTSKDTHTRYALIAFDEHGQERTDDPEGVAGKFSDRILADAAANPPSNVFFFSHGWKGDIPSAIEQYDAWIDAMVKLDADRNRMGPGFRPLWIGLHWPSLAWGEESFGGSSFDTVAGGIAEFREQCLAQFGDTPEVRAELDIIFKEHEVNAAAMAMPQHVVDAYNRLAAIIGYNGTGPGSAPEAEGKPFDPEASFDATNEGADFAGGGFLGPLVGPLRQLTFWTMKRRARTIGEGGMHDFISRLQKTFPKTPVHLMGHSFGCVIVSSILGGRDGRTPLPRPVDSLALVQGALSLWAYADRIKDPIGGTGYFNAAFRHPAVAGPIVVTRSRNDAAVGKAYPFAVALVLSNPDFAPDEELTPASLPIYGGIGTFGVRGYNGVIDTPMLQANAEYGFKAGRIYNLKSDAFIPDHNGIRGPEVAHAIWQAAQAALASTAAGGR